jgi:hypothetical protein
MGLSQTLYLEAHASLAGNTPTASPGHATKPLLDLFRTWPLPWISTAGPLGRIPSFTLSLRPLLPMTQPSLLRTLIILLPRLRRLRGRRWLRFGRSLRCMLFQPRRWEAIFPEVGDLLLYCVGRILDVGPVGSKQQLKHSGRLSTHLRGSIEVPVEYCALVKAVTQ